MGTQASTVLLDLHGQGLELMRELDLAGGVWRVSAIEELRGLPQNTVVLLAVKAETEIQQHRALLRAYPTVVIGMGLGPRSWSFAKMLGASGYVHDAAGTVALRSDLEQQLNNMAQRTWRAN